jgi:hypothetical protein
MTNPFGSVQEVVDGHANAWETGRFTSHIPLATEVPTYSAELGSVCADLVPMDFTRRGVIRDAPVSLLRGVRFIFNHTGIEGITGSLAQKGLGDVQKVTLEQVSAIDQDFRVRFGNIEHQFTTSPHVQLIYGRYNPKTPSASNVHLDYKGRRPTIGYKLYFDGPEEFGSIYYPGDYRLPGRGARFARALGGVEPYDPSPCFKRIEAAKEVLPAKIICVEPWNAVHSGPTQRESRGSLRGILSVAYDLSLLRVA